MNDWQLLRQIAYLIRAATWPGGSEKLFQVNSVIITAGITEDVGPQLSLPCCLLAPPDPQVDPDFGEEPGLLFQPIAVKVMVSVPAGSKGTAALMGANRAAAAAAGKGVLELAVPLMAVIRRMNDAVGVKLQAVHKSGVAVQIHPTLGYVAWQEHQLDCVATDAMTFPAPTRFVATGGAGQVVMTWKLPPDRFDYRRCILRRASGETPPASATVGTGIPLGGTPDGRGAVTVTDVIGAGTYSYSLFAAYNDYAVNPTTGADAPITDTSSAGDKDFSGAVSRAGVVVT